MLYSFLFLPFLASCLAKDVWAPHQLVTFSPPNNTMTFAILDKDKVKLATEKMTLRFAYLSENATRQDVPCNRTQPETVQCFPGDLLRESGWYFGELVPEGSADVTLALVQGLFSPTFPCSTAAYGYGAKCYEKCPSGFNRCFGGVFATLQDGHCLPGNAAQRDPVVRQAFGKGEIPLPEPCNPPEACEHPPIACEGPLCSDGPAVWLPLMNGPVAPVCRSGYAPASGDDGCCSACKPGFCRIDSLCVYCPGGPAPGWAFTWLFIVLVVLGVVFYLGRRESIFLFPNFVVVFRLAQALGIIALDVENQCHFGAGFAFEFRIFPALMGLSDYYASRGPSSSPGRLVLQLCFTLLYLMPFLMTPAVLFLKARFGRARESSLSVGPDATFETNQDEIAPLVALKRAVVCWFWLMILPLWFICTSHFLCEGGVMSNYPGSRCPNMGYFGTVTIALVLVLVMSWATVQFRARVISVTNNLETSTDNDNRLYSFVFGLSDTDCEGIWRLDLWSVSIIVLFKSLLFKFNNNVFMSLLVSTCLPSFFFFFASAHVFRLQPYKGKWVNHSLSLSHSATGLAFFVRFMRTCHFDIEQGFLHFVSLFVVALFLIATFGVMYGAKVNLPKKGQIRLFRDYKVVDDEGNVAAPDEELQDIPQK